MAIRGRCRGQCYPAGRDASSDLTKHKDRVIEAFD
jgi:hypothetical protein